MFITDWGFPTGSSKYKFLDLISYKSIEKPIKTKNFSIENKVILFNRAIKAQSIAVYSTFSKYKHFFEPYYEFKTFPPSFKKLYNLYAEVNVISNGKDSYYLHDYFSYMVSVLESTPEDLKHNIAEFVEGNPLTLTKDNASIHTFTQHAMNTVRLIKNKFIIQTQKYQKDNLDYFRGMLKFYYQNALSAIIQSNLETYGYQVSNIITYDRNQNMYFEHMPHKLALIESETSYTFSSSGRQYDTIKIQIKKPKNGDLNFQDLQELTKFREAMVLAASRANYTLREVKSEHDMIVDLIKKQ